MFGNSLEKRAESFSYLGIAFPGGVLVDQRCTR